MYVELSGEIIEVVSCSSLQGDVELNVSEGLKPFDTMRDMWKARSSLGVKCGLHERVVVLMEIYGVEPWGMREEE